jgi:O-antigen chain-terminating methyltransferase
MARWFLLDPTHIRLVHPETLRFILESKGFRVGPCEYRQPVPESEQIPRLVLGATPSRELDPFNGAIARVNKMLYGPLDYYLVARRV